MAAIRFAAAVSYGDQLPKRASNLFEKAIARRFLRQPNNRTAEAGGNVCFTPKADMCAATSDVRYGPIADIGARLNSKRTPFA
jgi:hypothetical protein